jgi:hypothetical protein
MGRAETLTAVRAKYQQYQDMSDDALGSALAAKYPQYRDLAPAAAAPPPMPKPDDRSILGGALADTFGVSGRPGAAPLTGTPGTKTPLGVILKPEGALEHAASMAVQAPLVAAGGALAGAARVAPAVGRIAASGAFGGAQAAAEGRAVGWGMLVDAAVAGLTEGAGTIVTKLPKVGLEALAEGLRTSRSAFEWATKAPGVAWEALKARFPNAKVIIPSLDPAKKITLEEAVERLAKLEGAAYQQARSEIVHWMNKLDLQKMMGGPPPRAGHLFRERTSKERFAPRRGTTLERLAGTLVRPEVQAGGRAGADAAATQEITPGVPVAVPSILRALEAPADLGHLAKRALVHVP